MKIFITWSGPVSQQLASHLRAWLPRVIQPVRPYTSDENILKGARWGGELALQLHEAERGILCVTSENTTAPWLLFEAGAISCNKNRASVCPLLFGVAAADLPPALGQLQAAAFTRDDVWALIRQINNDLGDRSVDPTVLEETFSEHWPRLSTEVDRILSAAPPADDHQRDTREILEELLAMSRASIERLGADSHERQPFSLSLWPALLRRGVKLLGDTRTIAESIGLDKPTLAEAVRQCTQEAGIEHSRELQVSIVDRAQVLLYHDWPDMIGKRASRVVDHGRDVYSDIVEHDTGVFAWVDRSSNVRTGPRGKGRVTLAMFAPAGADGARVVVEAHDEQI